MEEELEILLTICNQIKTSIQNQLEKDRDSRAYDGTPKPVFGNYVGALSNRISTGKLFESVTVQPVRTEKGFDIEITFPGADYWKWVNFGRRGRSDLIVGYNPNVKYPPLFAIEKWISDRGLPQFFDAQGRPISDRSRAFLIQRSIGEYGIFPTLFVNEGVQNAGDSVKFSLIDYGRALVKSTLDTNFR